MAKALLPQWDNPLEVGFNDLPQMTPSSMPSTWQPSDTDITPTSFPTPYGIAEATRFVLERGKFDTPLAEHFRILVQAAVLGMFEAETLEAGSDLDNLGRALRWSSKEEGFDFITILRDRETRLIFGATAPHCLFWPHARRTGDEWAQLQNRINRNLDLSRAISLLAEFRSSFQDNKLWNPNIAWMRGLDWIIGDTQASKNRELLRKHSRALAPIQVWVGGAVEGEGTNLQRDCLIYFPVYAKDFQQRLHTLCKGEFSLRERAVAILDDSRTEVALIRMPPEKVGRNPLLVGGGLVDIKSDSQHFRLSERPRLEDDKRGIGLVSVLNPLNVACRELKREGASASLEPAILFPDILRYLRQHIDIGSKCVLSKQVFTMVEQGQLTEIPQPEEIDGKNIEGFATKLRNGKQLVFLEKVGEVHVGDLSAFGYCLYQHFVGGRLADNKLHDFRGEVLLASSNEKPIDITDKAFKAVHDPNTRNELRRCLATLQRFCCFYQRLEEQSDGCRLAKKAAWAFGRWVCGSEPLAIGKIDTRTASYHSFGEEIVIPLGKDVILWRKSL